MLWKTLNENNKYEVSDTGEVRRRKNKRTLSGCVAQGYRSVKLTFKDSEQKRFYVHRLVATYFVHNSDPKNKTIVNHIDGNKMNNNAENLEWVTPRENNLHYYQFLRAKNKEKKQSNKPIPVKQFDLNHNLINSYPSISQASKISGISVAQIARCVHKQIAQANGFIWEEGSTTTKEEKPLPLSETPNKVKIQSELTRDCKRL